MTIAQKALEQLQPIPADSFLSNATFTNEVDKCCVIGHLQRINSDNPDDYKIGNCTDVVDYDWTNPLRNHSKKFMVEKYPENQMYYALINGRSFPADVDIAAVNNQKLIHFNQESGKERVIAFLIEMIAAGY